MNEIRQSLGGELDDHPAYELIEQVVDGAADDVTREIVESHAAVCPACEAELRDLREFAYSPPKSFPLLWLAVAAALLVLIGIASFVVLQRNSAQDLTPLKRAVITTGYGRADWDEAVRDALSRNAIERPQILRDLRPPAQVLRGTGTAPRAAMSPAGTVIETATPEFAWTPEPGAQYVVSVYEGVERITKSSVIRIANWQITQPLRRGRTYTWQVEVRHGNAVEVIPAPPAPPALFYVLGEQDAAALAEARRRFPGDRLLRGVLYARLGLQQQAVEELRQYAAQHPQSRALAENVARW